MSKTKIDEQVEKCADSVINGTLLAVDPSSGSLKSSPGYAIYHCGHLVESGILKIKSSQAIHVKLQQISQALRDEFDLPDVLAIELIPPYMKVKGYRKFFNKSLLSLHWSVGVVLSSIEVGEDKLVEVTPSAWRQEIPSNYLKTDENDAIMIGYTVVKRAFELKKLEVPKLDFDIITEME